MADRDLTLVLGVYRSGSTWAFNVARALIERHHGEVSAFYADAMSDVPGTALISTGPLLVKSHRVSVTSPSLLTYGRTILTWRDPRDAVVSMMDFLGFDFDGALRYVSESVAGVAAGQDLSKRFLAFKYENGPIGTPDAVMKIASLLEQPLTSDQAENIADRFSSRSVQRKILELQREGSIGSDAEPESFDPVTHWHPRHVGDGQVGKHVGRLTDEQRAAVEAANLAFMHGRYLQAPDPSASVAEPGSLEV